MRLLRFLFLTTLAGGVNTCQVAQAQEGSAITVHAVNQLVADWKARDRAHEYACLFAHRGEDGVVQIDSVGVTGTSAEMFCARVGGIARFVDENGGKSAFQAMIAAMDANPEWLIATEVYGVLQGHFGPVTEAPTALTVIRKPKAATP